MELLVQRGALKTERYVDNTSSDHRPSFISSTIPDITTDTLILAACGVDLERVLDDNWFLSDFYAFNYIFHGLGQKQTWMTPIPPTELLQRCGPIPHGNPYKPGKIVLSEDLITDRKITMPTIIPQSEMLQSFFQILAEYRAISEATKDGCPILILLFGHGQIEDGSIIIDYSRLPPSNSLVASSTYVSGQLLLYELEVAVQNLNTTIITIACYSGQWTSRPTQNTSTIAAASTHTESLSWPRVEGTDRQASSLFASSIFSFVTDQSTNNPQMPSYNNMYRQFLQIIEQRLTQLHKFHFFSFSARDNQYSDAWSSHSGIPLVDFKQRWDELPEIPAIVPNEPILDQTPGIERDSQNAAEITTASATGSLRARFRTVLRSANQNKITIARNLAKSHYATCPGDWQLGIGARHGAAIHRFLANKSPTDSDIRDIMQLIAWRESTMDRVDMMVELLGLPRPFGLRCALWNRAGPMSVRETIELQDLHGRIFLHLGPAGFYTIFNQTSCGFPYAEVPFRRPAYYVAACMALASYNEDQVSRVINEVKQLVGEWEDSSTQNKQRVRMNFFRLIRKLVSKMVAYGVN